MAILESALPAHKNGDASGEDAPTRDSVLALETIGARLRRAREAKNLSIRQLEEISGVNRNSIARAEQGRRIVYDALLRMCSALGVHLGQFIESGHVDNLVTVQRANEQVWLPRNAEDAPDLIDPKRLALSDQRRSLVDSRGSINFVSILDTGLWEERYSASISELFERSRTRTHSGEEFLYVLDGRIMLSVAGQTYDLETGDSAGIAAGEPHNYSPIGPDLPARILTVTLRRPTAKNGS
jgi:transcriptional regulator with XRE-family HTH domain